MAYQGKEVWMAILQACAICLNVSVVGHVRFLYFLVVFEIGEPPKDLDKAKRLPVWAWTARVPLCRLLQKNKIYWSTDTPTVSRSIGYYRQGRRGPNRDQELGARSWRSNSSCNNCSSTCTVSVCAVEKCLRVCVLVSFWLPK